MISSEVDSDDDNLQFEIENVENFQDSSDYELEYEPEQETEEDSGILNNPVNFQRREKGETEYLLVNGTFVFFKTTEPQQLYIDENNPESYADLSISGDNHLYSAGEKDNVLYFYTVDGKEIAYYRARVKDLDGKTTIKFSFIRSENTKGKKQYLAIQQPFILNDYLDNLFRIYSFEGELLPASGTENRRLFAEMNETEFFCHNDVVFLIRKSENVGTHIENAGDIIIVYIQKDLFLPKCLPEGKGQEFSVYAKDDSLIYILCKDHVLAIGPSESRHFLLSCHHLPLKTSSNDYIIGFESGKMVTSTEQGLIRTTLGEHRKDSLEMLEEMLKRLEDRMEREISSNRATISGMYQTIQSQKASEQDSKERETKLFEENEKLRNEFDQFSDELKSVSGRSFKSSKAGENQEYTSKFSNEFIVGKILGHGGFGFVFEATNTFDEAKYAVKRIAVKPNEYDLRKTLKEVRAMAQLDHPGIVRYNSTWVERPPDEWQHEEDFKTLEKLNLLKHKQEMLKYEPNSVFIYIQMQLCECSLYDWLEKNPKQSTRDLKTIKFWFEQIVQAVQYIHGKGMIHRDLKPRNILFVEANRIKLCDLGLVTTTKITEDGEEISTLRTDIGTELYKSPEQKCFIASYSSKTDIFALGLIFTEMCLVMSEKEREKVFEDICGSRLLANTFDDLEISKFIKWVASHESKDRPTCKEILNHAFMQGLTDAIQ